MSGRRLSIVAGTDYDRHLERYFAPLTVGFRTKLEALVPVVRGAIIAAKQVALETEEDTNAEVEMQDIIEDLESALGRIESVLTDP